MALVPAYPVNQSYPSLNDIEPSWSDVNFTVSPNGAGLIDMSAIASLKWSSKVEVGARRGASGGRVKARTTGQGSQEASGELYLSGYRSLLRALIPLAPMRGNQAIVGLVAFNIHVQYTPPGEIDIYEAILKGCRLLGQDRDTKEGTDPDKVSITLNPIEIVELIDGVEVVLL